MKYGGRFLTPNAHRALLCAKRHAGYAVRSIVACVRDLRCAVRWQWRGF